ncbi:Protein phosphatase 2C 1 [Chytridiales sp. JEL 0842]|nr:Protein phosphatase 2C 1 [Chytridiales sp. JEL 0842]
MPLQSWGKLTGLSFLADAPIAISSDYIAIAKGRWVGLHRKDEDNILLESETGTSNDLNADVTAIALLMFLKKPYVLCGYSNGYLRVYDSKCKDVFTRRVYPGNIKCIKIESEDIVIVYSDNAITAFNRGRLMSTIENLPDDSPLLFYNYRLPSQELLHDVTSISRIQHTLLEDPTNSTSLPPSTRVECLRYLAAGSNPMLVTYLSLAPDHSSSITGFIATRLTNAVSFATSFWRSTPESTEEADRTSAKSISPYLYLHDPNRTITKLHLAPPCPKSGLSTTAAAVDSLGRVLIIEMATGEIVRLIKGMRNAQIGWIRTRDTLLLAIYSHRGVLEIHAPRSGERLEAYQVGKGLRLLQSARRFKDLSLDLESSEEFVSSCYLVSPNGNVQRIVPNLAKLDTRSPFYTADEISQWTEDTLHEKQKILRAALSKHPTGFTKIQYLKTMYNIETTELDSIFRDSILPSTAHKSLDIQDHHSMSSLGVSFPNLQASLNLRLQRHLINIAMTVTQNTSSSETRFVSSGVKERDESIEQILRDTALYNIKSTLATAQSLELEDTELKRLHLYLFEIFEIDCSGARCKTGSDSKTGLRMRTDAPGKSILKSAIALFNPILVRNWNLLLWKRTVLDKLELKPDHWAYLLLHLLPEVSEDFLFGSFDNALRLAHVVGFIMDLAVEFSDMSTVYLMIDFCWRNKSVRLSVIIFHTLQIVLKHADVPLPPDITESLQLLRSRLDDCLILYKNGFASIMQSISLTAGNLGEFESTSLARIISAAYIEKYCKPRNDDEPMPEPKAVIHHFGPIVVTNVPIYNAFYLARYWMQKPTEVEILDLCTANIKMIKHPVLRNAAICCLFEKVFGQKLSAIIDLVDKARRVPRDNICIRMCGLDVKSAISFFEKLLELLNEDFLILDEMYTKAEDILSDLTVELHKPPLRSFKDYANDSFGTMMTCFRGSPSTPVERWIGRRVVVQHQAMLKVLKAIFTNDIKMVRPSRLFPSSTRFGHTFLVAYEADEDHLEAEEIQKERAIFLEKLTTISPGVEGETTSDTSHKSSYLAASSDATASPRSNILNDKLSHPSTGTNRPHSASPSTTQRQDKQQQQQQQPTPLNQAKSASASSALNIPPVASSSGPERIMFASPLPSTTVLDEVSESCPTTLLPQPMFSIHDRIESAASHVAQASNSTTTVVQKTSNNSKSKHPPGLGFLPGTAPVTVNGVGKNKDDEDDDDEDDEDDDEDDNEDDDDDFDDDDDDEEERKPTKRQLRKAEAAKKAAEAALLVEQGKAKFRVGFAEDRNKRFRRTMEDAHAFHYNFGGIDGHGFFGIYDGHAGRGAAEWCGNNLHQTLTKLLHEHPKSSVPELLNKSFVLADSQMAKKGLFSGCTAIVALIRVEDREEGAGEALFVKRKRVLYTANVGDARAVLSRNGKAVRLSYDHKGSDALEAQRIVDAGGFVINNRVNGVLAVTRALGDASMKEWVIGNPYTTETVLDDTDDLLILACDGIWDVCSDQDAVDFVNNISDPQAASKGLMDFALDRNSTDNLSVLVIRFDALA